MKTAAEYLQATCEPRALEAMMKTASELGLTEQELAEQVALAEQVIGEIILEERIETLCKALRTLEGLPEVYTSDRAYNIVTQALTAIQGQ